MGKEEIKSILLNFIFYKAHLKIEGFVVKLFFYRTSQIFGNVYSLTLEQIVSLNFSLPKEVC